MPSLFNYSNYNWTLPTVFPKNPSSIGAVNPQIGMSSGYIQPTPHYQTTSPVQAKFDWSARPHTTPTEQQAPAGQHGWGAQQGYQPFDVDAFVTQMLTPAWQQQATATPSVYGKK